jgi:hypothetical protein
MTVTRHNTTIVELRRNAIAAGCVIAVIMLGALLVQALR